MQNKIPKDCRSCRFLWTGGIKEGGHDRWCCKHSAPAPKIRGHCKTVGGFEAKGGI